MSMSSRRVVPGALAAAAGLFVSSAASAAPVGPWALSEFLDAVEKDGVERVTFDDAGRALVAVDADGGRHRVEILPSEGPEILANLRKHDVQFAVEPPASDPLQGAGYRSSVCQERRQIETTNSGGHLRGKACGARKERRETLSNY